MSQIKELIVIIFFKTTDFFLTKLRTETDIEDDSGRLRYTGSNYSLVFPTKSLSTTNWLYIPANTGIQVVKL